MDNTTAQPNVNSKPKQPLSQIEETVINLVNQERWTNLDAVVFVTDRIAFRMRDLIKIFRKNYYGIFDEPKDINTGRDKTWVPLTETFVEAVVKNIDLDTKDINFKAKNPNGVPVTALIRSLAQDYLHKTSFGETLDESERDLAIDGTVVWKTWEEKDNGKTVLKRRNVDLLNFFIDPSANSIQEAYRVTERALMFADEIEGMSGWKNNKDIQGKTGLERNEGKFTRINVGTAKYVDVWELWGKVPKWVVTGKKDDENSGEEVEAHIIVSGLESGDPRVHLIEKNDGLRPYEECRYRKVRGRWYGRGVAEMLMGLQLWANIIVNIRINRSFVSQLGIFKMKKGSGVTPAQFKRLSTNGVLVLNDMNDLEQLVMQEASQASYKDEDIIFQWAQRLTSAFDTATGEPLPSSTPATTAAIQSQAAKSAFSLVKDALGSFLERWMDKHALPIIAKTVKVGDIIRLSGDTDELKHLIERVVFAEAAEKMEEMYEQGYLPTDVALQEEINSAKAKLLSRGSLFVEALEKLISDHVDTVVYVTNEEFDKSVMSQNLVSMLQLVDPTQRDQVTEQIFDLMGLVPPKKQPMPAMPQGAPPMPGQPQGMPQMPGMPPTMPGQVQQANTING